ncbi:MAG TPA: hypothetical protein VLS88_15465 [Polyangiales bacterium]|nr:hypothetical protein [Polyangiales bacterium]
MVSRFQLDPVRALRFVVDALRGRLSVSLALIRGRLALFSDKVALEVEAVSPGLRVRGEALALGAPIAFSARIDVDGVHVDGPRRTVRIRLSEVELSTPPDAPGPLADAVRKGMIDTDNPATLIGNMMPSPDFIVEARGRDIVVDLMRIPAIARDPRLRSALALASSYLGVTGIFVADDAIVLQLGALPGGPKEAALSTARTVLFPVVRRLWPEGFET